MSLSVWAFIAICLFMLERNGSEGSAGPYNSHNPSCTSPCPPVSQCPSVDNCVHGVGQDYCGCCLKCLKGEGQTCGGEWDKYGSCGVGLNCEGGNNGDSPGICRSAQEYEVGILFFGKLNPSMYAESSVKKDLSFQYGNSLDNSQDRDLY